MILVSRLPRALLPDDGKIRTALFLYGVSRKLVYNQWNNDSTYKSKSKRKSKFFPFEPSFFRKNEIKYTWGVLVNNCEFLFVSFIVDVLINVVNSDIQ